MIDDLKEIKKIYGEQFSHFCRDYFVKILGEPGVLLNILKNNFGPTKSLYKDIIDNHYEVEFKNYIYMEYDNIRNDLEDQTIEVKESPYELLDKVGYELFECKSEEEVQSFRKWYREDEIICTIYNGGRLNKCYVFFAVKKNAQEIKRDNFANPKREDEYSTSVLSIQFPKHGVCVPNIISRYNHTVRDPNGTYGCDLNKIVNGLEYSFNEYLKNRGIVVNKFNKKNLNLPNYILGLDGRYYRYNMEVNGIYYCENNIIIDHGQIKNYEHEKYLIIDYFIVDLVNKTIKLYDENINNHDSFIDSFNNISSIRVEKNNEIKKIIIKIDGYDDIIITIDNHNCIIGYKDSNIKALNNSFLRLSKYLKLLDTKNVKIIGNEVLTYNETIEHLDFPNVEIVGDNFLRFNNCLKTFKASKVKMIGKFFCCTNREMKELNLPEVEVIGDSFLYYNYILKTINMPKVKIIGTDFIYFNHFIDEINFSNVEIIGNNFLPCVKNLKYFNMPITVNHGKGIYNPYMNNLLINKENLDNNRELTGRKK